MCTGMEVLMGASLALSAGQMVMGMGAQTQQANQQAGQASYLAQVARNNQIIAQQNQQLATQQAARDTQEGDVAATQQQTKTRLLLGSQRAALASQGGDIDAGSPLDIQTDTAAAGIDDVNAIRYNAALRAYNDKLTATGYGNQANAFGAQAGMYSMAATDATANLPYGIGSSLLGGASSITSKAYDWMRNGTPRSPLTVSGGSGDPNVIAGP